MADLALVMTATVNAEGAATGLAAVRQEAEHLGGAVSGMAEGMGSGAAATEKMAGTAESAGGTFAALKEHASGLGDQLKDVASTAAGFIGANVLMSFGSDLASSFEKGISSAETLGESIHKLMLSTGESADTLSPMVAALQRAGVSSDEATGALDRLEKNMTAVQNATDKTLAGTTGVVGAFKDLGINVDDLHNSMPGLNDMLMRSRTSSRRCPTVPRRRPRRWRSSASPLGPT